MSDVKMSDVFNMLTYANGREIDTGELVDSSGNWWATFSSKHAKHAATAINSYDSNQELIAKLQADNELLRYELKKFLPMAFDENGDEDCDNSHGDFQYNEGSECMGESVIAVLAATAKG